MDLYAELIAVIDLLNAEGIEYAVCGGIAVALHGYVRFTHDLDILVRSEDTSRIAAARKQGMSETIQRRVDMSPRGIELRLRQLAGLYKLGISLKKAQPAPDSAPPLKDPALQPAKK